MTNQIPASSAAGIRWDLTDLYRDVDDPALAADSKKAHEQAQRFEAEYRGRIATLTADQAAVLARAVAELETLSERMDRPAVFAMLLHAGKTDDPRHGALVARTQEEGTRINKHLIFFDLEWIQVPDDVAAGLTADPKLARHRHFLERKRVWKPHYLSEAEEKILDEKSVTGKSAFGRLFEETNASMKFSFRGTDLSLQEVLARLYDADRSIRQDAAEAVTRGLRENRRLLTFIFNTILQDHQSDCGLRSYPSSIHARNLGNEIRDETVEALLQAAEGGYVLVQRYYRLKQRLLGLDRLYDWDRYAPLSADLPACDWATGRRIVKESYEAFSPEAGRIVGEFFAGNWIDAELRPGKRGGAFSASGVPSSHPFVLLNWTDRLRDVMTLAHELGHGVHQYLSRDRGYLQCHTPLTTAEMASVFGEMLTFHRLQEVYTDPKQRLAMLCSKIEDAFATVFRQVVMTRFELDLHRARREQGELASAAIDELWMRANRSMFGDALELSEGYACWWQYIGHFIRSPFYCYAYAFGELLVLALYQKYRQEGADFVPRYLELLAAGGSDSPEALLRPLGVDVGDPDFWKLGLSLLEEMVGQAEKLAEG